MNTAQKYLDFLNTTYFDLHKKYEDLFWISYMGDNSVNTEKDRALSKRDAFRANPEYLKKVTELIKESNQSDKKRLKLWLTFFKCYQTPKEAISLKEKIDALESEISKKRGEREEGYVDPYTKKFIKASGVSMRTMMVTNPDEKYRKACFDAREKMAIDLVEEYVVLVNLRNTYARMLGYSDFYDFKIKTEEGMTKKELFSIFDSIYEKTKYAKKNVVEMEKKMPNLRKPWNFGYMMSGDFIKEEDPYFPFDEALTRWGRSFAALGIDFKGGKLQLDLLDRKGKSNNGFCHWPDMVRFEKDKRFAGSSNFTCTVVYEQPGSGEQGYHTLFHEGGHAAHLLNSSQKDVCVNHEYAPMSTAWAETQSMFLDTMFTSIEWAVRYAKDAKGAGYPFDIYERRLKKLYPLRPLALHGIMFVSNFEKEIYEIKHLDVDKAMNIARKNYRKYFERSEDSLTALDTHHIYFWDSACSYHGYGLAQLALAQWREYFYKKYGYIVDNPHVGKEMKKVWEFAGSKTFSEFVKIATGKKLTSNAYLKNINFTIPKILKIAKERIKKLDAIKPYIKSIDLDARIHMVSGKIEISNNKKSFEDMAEKYKKWLQTQKISPKQ